MLWSAWVLVECISRPGEIIGGQIGPQFYQVIPKWFHFLHILSLRVSKAWMSLTSSEDRNSDLWTLIWQKVRRFLQLNARDSGARLTHRSPIFQVSILFCQWWNSAKWDWGSSLAQAEAYRTVCGLFNRVTWKISQRVIPKAHESKFYVSVSSMHAQLLWYTPIFYRGPKANARWHQ